MVRVGVDAEGVALSAGGVTDGGVANHTGCFERRVADLAGIVRAELENDGEAAGLAARRLPTWNCMIRLLGTPPMYLRRVYAGP